MAISLSQLSQRILKLRRDIEPNANEMTKDAAKAFVNKVLDATPVDTGRLVSSWKVGLNYKPRGSRLFVPGKLGSTATVNRETARAEAMRQIDRRVTGQTISIVNDTPYIIYVNKGEFQRYVDQGLLAAIDAVKQRKLI